MYGCESWTIKKVKCQRIDAFELWWLRRLLRVLWTVRRSNQSILEEISPEYSLEGLMLKLKFQNFGNLRRGTKSQEKTLGCWERLKAGGEGDDRGWDGWMASPTRWTWVCTSSRNWLWTGKSGVLQFIWEYVSVQFILVQLLNHIWLFATPETAARQDIQRSHPLSSPPSPAFYLFQNQGPYQWVSSFHQVTKVVELQFQH